MINIPRRRGSQMPQAKLTENQVRVIKEKLRDGVAMAAIARKFEVDPATIGAIKKGITWKHVQ